MALAEASVALFEHAGHRLHRQKLVAFYVEQHNSHLPHSAFMGQTPDEMYFATGRDIPKQLDAARITARETRMKHNRSRTWRTCEEPIAITCG